MGISADGQDWQVRITDEAIGGEDGDERFILGSSDEADNLIVVDGTLPKSRQEEVLLHEMIHIADPEMPEFAVRTMSVRLYGLLRGNDLLAKGLLDRVDAKPISKADMDKINRHNAEIKAKAENGMPIMMRESEGVAARVTSPVYDWSAKAWK